MLTTHPHATERLAQRKAALAALGVPPVSELAPIRIDGAVVAQPGLTAVSAGGKRLTAGSIYGEPTVLDRVERIVDGAPVSEIRPARMILAEPSTMLVDRAIWVASAIELADDTTVVLRWPHKYLTIMTERLTVGQNVTLTWEQPVHDTPAPPPTPFPAFTTAIEDGAPGGGGRSAGTAAPGVPGADAPWYELWLLELEGRPSVRLIGQNGTAGAAGGQGGMGGNGHPGTPGEAWFAFCTKQPGPGGNGGQGGQGGRGGDGGAGGRGGRVDLFAPPDVHAALTQRSFLDDAGGRGGRGGAAGRGGEGGPAGGGGWQAGVCGPAQRGLAGTTGLPGTPGTDGADGKAFRRRDGDQFDAYEWFEITPDDFREQLTAPRVEDVRPQWARKGETLVVLGALFSSGDAILLDGAPIPTTYVSESQLTAVLPAAAGGRREVRVRQRDGTLSNRGSVLVLPVPERLEPAGRLRPDTDVTIVGSGFAEGMHVLVNDEAMEVRSVALDRATFALRRPVRVQRNPAGEQVTVRVTLGNDSSNELAAVLDTHVMLVVGDSVAWGQGHRPNEKTHARVQAAISAARGGIGAYSYVLAHSGATIGVGDATVEPPIPGEIPVSRPTVLQQVEAFDLDPALVDLVYVGAGINDVDVTRILNPLIDAAVVAALVDEYCYRDMKTLLEKITSKFENADVVVTGYYPLVSLETDLSMIDRLLAAFGIMLGLVLPALQILLTLGAAAASLFDVRARMALNSRVFWERSTLRLRAAVDEVNDRLDREQIRFAAPRFTAANAVMAPAAWLYGFNPDGSLQDPIAAQRAEVCRLNEARAPDHCGVASIGHPNDLGVTAYVETVLAALDARDPLRNLPPFPQKFLFGVGTSAYQVEGGIRTNDWDFFASSNAIRERVKALTKLGGFEIDLQPAGDAVRHGDLDVLRADLDRAAALGLNAYRFSVEWARLVPSPGAQLDASALAYYDAVVAETKRRGMEPIVTLQHLTLPRWVSTPPEASLPGLPFAAPDDRFNASLRGWESIETVGAYEEFVAAVVSHYADDVKTWLTVNEPVGSIVGLGYIGGVWPPGFNDAARAKAALMGTIRGHVRAYDRIKSIDSSARVGFAHVMTAAKPSAGWWRPPSGDAEGAVRQFEYFYNRYFLDAVLLGKIDRNVDHRPDRQDVVGPQELVQFLGRPVSGMDPWKPKADFVGLNYYRSAYVFWDAIVAAVAPLSGGRFVNDLHGHLEEPHNLLNDLGWEISPESLYRLLTQLRSRYRLPILVTENGTAETDDRNRGPALVAHLEQTLRAVAEGVDVLGYLYWTLVDNWELHEHYRPEGRFGLFTVDRDSPRLERLPTKAALAMAHVVETRGSGIAETRERYGALTPGGDRAITPRRSAGRTWEGRIEGGPPITIQIGRAGEGLTGFLADGDARAWLDLSGFAWDADDRRLTFSHQARSGVGARSFESVLGPDGELAGTVTSDGTVRPWKAVLVPAAGAWKSARWPYHVEIDRLEPLPGGWRARYLSSGPASAWEVIEHVDAQVSSLALSTPAFRLAAMFADDGTLRGHVTTGASQAEEWVGTRAPDDLPLPAATRTPPPLAWQPLAVDVFADAARTIPIDPAKLAAGQLAFLTVRAVNTGSTAWSNTGAAAMMLGTASPRDRSSRVATAEWPAATRPARLAEASVAPQGTGTFTFPIRAPASAARLEESFALVTANGMWLDETRLSVVVEAAPRPPLACAVSSVSLYADSSKAIPLDPARLRGGTTGWFVVEVTNTGARSWRRNTVSIATNAPRDRPSPIAAPGWRTPTRPATTNEPAVPTAARGMFEFPFIVPAAGGTFDETFGFVDGSEWFAEGDVALQLVATPGLQPKAWARVSLDVFTDPFKLRRADPTRLVPQQTVWVVARVRNTGVAAWERDAAPIILGTVGDTPADRDQPSPLAAAGWLAPSRPAAVKEQRVAPGEIGKIEFVARLPAGPGAFTERFALVRGTDWLEEDEVALRLQSQPPTAQFAWALSSRSAYVDQRKNRALNLGRLRPAQTGWIVLRVVNTGKATWLNSGPRAVLLATEAPGNRASAVATAAWISPSRPARLREARVAPGGTGTFEFPFKAPAAAGARRERFTLVSAQNWFPDIGINFVITVA
jgi:beta-glucosidase/6-phospho-beta-glucosidase/beta-galactosidase